MFAHAWPNCHVTYDGVCQNGLIAVELAVIVWSNTLSPRQWSKWAYRQLCSASVCIYDALAHSRQVMVRKYDYS